MLTFSQITILKHTAPQHKPCEREDAEQLLADFIAALNRDFSDVNVSWLEDFGPDCVTLETMSRDREKEATVDGIISRLQYRPKNGQTRSSLQNRAFGLGQYFTVSQTQPT